MKYKLVLILLIAVILYLTGGAFLFRWLERKPSAGQPLNSTAAYANLTRYLSESYPCLNDEDKSSLVIDIITAYKAGIVGLPGAVESDPWELSRSFFYVSTVITTIGYGSTTPVTTAGRLTTIAYALIGIPLCLIFLAGLGEKLVRGFKKIESFFSICKRCSTFCHVLRVTMLVMMGWIIFVMVPAALFTIVEDWTYVKSLYFTFITLSTIGFGDVVPSSVDGQKNPLYRVLSVIWVYVGLAWLSSIVSLLAEIFQKGVSEGEHKVKEKLKKSHHELTFKLKQIGSFKNTPHNHDDEVEGAMSIDLEPAKEGRKNNNQQEIKSTEENGEGNAKIDSMKHKEMTVTTDGTVSVSL